MVNHRLLRLAAILGFALTSAVSLHGRAGATETPEDASYVSKRLQEILEFEETGTVIPWKNPKTKNRGIIKVVRTYYQNPKLPCRDYIRTQELRGDLTMTVQGTGCRIGDERWFLEEQPPDFGDPEAASRPVKKAPAKSGAATKPPVEAKAPAKEASEKETEPPVERPVSTATEIAKEEKAVEVETPDKDKKESPRALAPAAAPKFDYRLPTRTALSDNPAS
jgi:surface antigen